MEWILGSNTTNKTWKEGGTWHVGWGSGSVSMDD